MNPASPQPHPAALAREALLARCDVVRQRRSGPGGQHRNKVETAVRLTYRPTGTIAEASERRSQAANLAAAVRRLRINLALEVRCPIGEIPSDLWKRRCRDGAISINVDHDEFPALLAEALDELAELKWNAGDAAARLDCTLSQLVKLLRKEPRSLQQLNDRRRAAGLAALR